MHSCSTGIYLFFPSNKEFMSCLIR